MKKSGAIAKECGIYKITDCKTGRFYIGSANDLQKRFSNHMHRFRAGTHTNPILQSLFNARGDDLVYSVVQLCGLDEKYDVEQRFLDELNPPLNVKKVALGMPTGSEHPNFGKKVSSSTRAKLSAALKGVAKSEEHRKKAGAAQKGKRRKPLSEDHRRKISEANSGDKAYWFGREKSAEHRDKIRASVTGHVPSDQTKEKLRLAILGTKRSDETKEKLRQQKLGAKNPMYGKKRTEEAIAATIAANTGLKRSEETRAKLRAAWDRRRAEGKVMTPEIRAKISATKAARKAANKHR